jgi:NAD(P)H-dependent flavin oxidoreductase YrpB (nitropropane dioxygenase family)
MAHPMIIQGGMGVAISDWRLARAVSQAGQLGVVSGTGINTVLARRLQDGDPDGHLRRALEHFPVPEMARRVLDRYFIPGGKAPDAPYKLAPMFTIRPNRDLLELSVVANFAEVWLAKEGHDGVVGINLMEKLQLPNLSSLYGAMLGGVDYVLMGAGIPREIPGALDALAEHRPASLKLHVEQTDDDVRTTFDPRSIMPEPLPEIRRPYFLAIISSATLAIALARRSTGRVDGFIIEGPTAGGHNAPPRGAVQLNERGEPLYGPRDAVDLAKIRELDIPFWMAGSYAEPERLREALDEGAQGIQVGTAFALCRESGLAPELKREVLDSVIAGSADVLTDAKASPTGFPFKVAQLEGTLSAAEVYAERPRICDLGYLREMYQRPDGSIGFRCPAEPVGDYVKKGGAIEATEGRKCLCNGLMANAGWPQARANGYRELPLVTAGDDLRSIRRFLKPGADSYSAQDVLDYLLG